MSEALAQSMFVRVPAIILFPLASLVCCLDCMLLGRCKGVRLQTDRKGIVEKVEKVLVFYSDRSLKAYLVLNLPTMSFV